MIYALTGNMVMSMVTGTMLSLGQTLGVLKEFRGFDYYSVLPIKKINFCAPVFVADEMLPKWLLYTSYCFPTRYVASALRSGVIGIIDWSSIFILSAFCIVSILWVEKHMDWRM